MSTNRCSYEAGEGYRCARVATTRHGTCKAHAPKKALPMRAVDCYACGGTGFVYDPDAGLGYVGLGCSYACARCDGAGQVSVLNIKRRAE